jgi:dephospho-CoA kinase
VITEKRRWVLSGGIGSGKSEVGRMLAATGVRVIDADRVGHRVLEPAGRAFAGVVARWPDVLRNGVIDRKKLAAIVFSDPEQLRELESLTHPAIFGSIRSDLEGFQGIAVVEAPILSDALGWPRIVIDAPDEMRLARVVARGMDPDDARRRLTAQPSRGEWLAAGDLVIPNTGALEELARAVDLILPDL